MNIRIGNDIKVSVALSEFGSIDVNNIKFMTCTFYKSEEIEEDYNPFPIFHHSSQYTVHGCGIPTYNVIPSNLNYSMFDPYDCGHTVCDRYVAPCKIEGTNIVSVFPAEALREEGTYSCHFDIKVYEEGWDIDNLHSYRIIYDDILSLTSSATSSSSSSSIITPNNNSKINTYIFANTDEYLTDLDGNYTSIIASIDGFELDSLLNQSKYLLISGTGNRIVVLSTYNNLKVMYNTFQFPMNMYKLDNGYYMYVSTYKYSNYSITLTITQGTVNTIQTENPYITGNGSSTDWGGSSDSGNTSDSSTDTTNKYATTVLTLGGSYSSNNIKVNGIINNYSLIL